MVKRSFGFFGWRMEEEEEVRSEWQRSRDKWQRIYREIFSFLLLKLCATATVHVPKVYM